MCIRDRYARVLNIGEHYADAGQRGSWQTHRNLSAVSWAGGGCWTSGAERSAAMSLASGQTGAAAAPAGKDGRAAGEVRVLVVDDEKYLADLVAAALKYEGWQTRTATSGMAALREARSFRPDLVVLDVMLPDLDGFEVLRRLRAEGIDTPVVFLTARDSTEDRVAGLTIGGDDYVTKPFSLEELVARLRALLRRMGLTKVHQDSELRRGGQLIELTPTEFELLRYLMRNPRRVLSKAQILDRVWHYDFGGQSNIVELYVGYLRKKIDRGREPLLHTVRGVGYVLKPAM